MTPVISLSALALTLGVAVAQAAPLCPEFLSPDTMPKKYRKLAPVVSGGPSDWILTRDQMKTRYAPSAEAVALMTQVVAGFADRGLPLALMIAPPRPLVAGQAQIDALAPASVTYDVAAVSEEFDAMIDALRDTGAIVPNLLDTATRSDAVRARYYYRHDTHWTPQGAADSAFALAAEVAGLDLPGFEGVAPVAPRLVEGGPDFSEKGSLAQMAKAVCGAHIAPVSHAIPTFPSADLGLLGDGPQGPRVVLAGSSFSNRYKKDAYRVADAVAGTLGATVTNLSVSGGGAIGGIEGALLTGQIAPGAQDLVIWELPYTANWQAVGTLRQVLGALTYDPAMTPAATLALNGSGEDVMDLTADTQLLVLDLPGATLSEVKVDLRFVDGSKDTLKLRRSTHVQGALRSDLWAISLAGLQERGLTSATLRYDGGKLTAGGQVARYSGTAMH